MTATRNEFYTATREKNKIERDRIETKLLKIVVGFGRKQKPDSGKHSHTDTHTLS